MPSLLNSFTAPVLKGGDAYRIITTLIWVTDIYLCFLCACCAGRWDNSLHARFFISGRRRFYFIFEVKERVLVNLLKCVPIEGRVKVEDEPQQLLKAAIERADLKKG